MSTHTPGPWEVNGGIRGYEFAVIKPTHTTGPKAGTYIAVADIPEGVKDGEAEANARLIAAAPELLFALRILLGTSECSCIAECDAECTHTIARAAIAKAEGRWMADKANGGPAFPNMAADGMSLRDYFAGQALAGLLANRDMDSSNAVTHAYQFADAMLVERAKREGR